MPSGIGVMLNVGQRQIYKCRQPFISTRLEPVEVCAAAVVGLCELGWYPLTSDLSLVGRRALEYPAPQVMLHMACSLLRRIKCQL